MCILRAGWDPQVFPHSLYGHEYSSWRWWASMWSFIWSFFFVNLLQFKQRYPLCPSSNTADSMWFSNRFLIFSTMVPSAVLRTRELFTSKILEAFFRIETWIKTSAYYLWCKEFNFNHCYLMCNWESSTSIIKWILIFMFLLVMVSQTSSCSILPRTKFTKEFEVFYMKPLNVFPHVRLYACYLVTLCTSPTWTLTIVIIDSQHEAFNSILSGI